MRVEMRRAIARSCVEMSIDRPSARSSARIDDDHLLGRGVDAVQRLVQQQQRPLGEERAREQHALALAARELADLRARAVGETDAGELVERVAAQRTPERAVPRPSPVGRPSAPRRARSRGSGAPRRRSEARTRVARTPRRCRRSARARRGSLGRGWSCRRRSGRPRPRSRPAARRSSRGRARGAGRSAR